MKTPQQIKNEVEKGCGKYIGTWKTSQKIICGCYTNMLELCPSCQAKLSILTEYDKAIKEMILKMKSKARESSFMITYGNSDMFKIMNIYDKEIDKLLSKIGDVSEVEK